MGSPRAVPKYKREYWEYKEEISSIHTLLYAYVILRMYIYFFIMKAPHTESLPFSTGCYNYEGISIYNKVIKSVNSGAKLPKSKS